MLVCELASGMGEALLRTTHDLTFVDPKAPKIHQLSSELHKMLVSVDLKALEMAKCSVRKQMAERGLFSHGLL